MRSPWDSVVLTYWKYSIRKDPQKEKNKNKNQKQNPKQSALHCKMTYLKFKYTDGTQQSGFLLQACWRRENI